MIACLITSTNRKPGRKIISGRARNITHQRSQEPYTVLVAGLTTKPVLYSVAVSLGKYMNHIFLGLRNKQGTRIVSQ